MDLRFKKYGIIKKTGAWYLFCDPFTGEILEDETGKPVKVNGMAKVLDFLKLNPDYFDKLQKFILADIAGEELTSEEKDEIDSLSDDSIPAVELVDHEDAF